MENEELKRKLMGLWEKTTHNSKESLSLLFDYYFNSEYIEYEENDGKIISALCGIPYHFGYGQNKLKALYLLTLSSEEGFRKKGILSELLQRFNTRVADDFDFTFLVPHTELLADYFGTQGYFSSFFILEERFTPLHDFRNDYNLYLLESDERIRELKKGLVDELHVLEYQQAGSHLSENSNESTENSPNFETQKIIDFVRKNESRGASRVNLCHTDHDLQYILCGESIRQLRIFVAYSKDESIAGVAFIQKEDLKRIRVVAYYISEISAYFALLDYVRHQFPDFSISVNTYDPKNQPQTLIQLNYASANPAGGDLDNTFGSVEIPFNINKLLQPMGMVRILRFDRILNYIAETRREVDLKLHIRDLYPEDSNSKVFELKNGKLQSYEEEDLKKDKSILILSRKEISELLLRKNDSSNLIMEAFGIPRLNLQMRLLPC